MRESSSVYLLSNSCVIATPKPISSIAAFLTALPVYVWPTAFVNYPAALCRIIGLPVRAFVGDGITVLG
jgi:hypothetical protein